MGWKIEGAFDENIKKCVAMVLPHTSWHDFYLGVFTRGIGGLEINWVGKKELFRFPFGFYFRWMGGAPLDRKGSLNKVDAIASIFDEYKEFRLGIAPEGTRKKVNELKSNYQKLINQLVVCIINAILNF